jgi:hypothetical protein
MAQDTILLLKERIREIEQDEAKPRVNTLTDDSLELREYTCCRRCHRIEGELAQNRDTILLLRERVRKVEQRSPGFCVNTLTVTPPPLLKMTLTV